MDDVELNEFTLKKYATKLYIVGDLKVPEGAGKWLDQLEYLNIRGHVQVAPELKEKLMSVLTEISGELKLLKKPKGRHIEDKMTLRLSKWLIEQETEGISVSDCMKVTLDEDIPCGLILERLSFSDCVDIKCTAEQEAAVATVSEDVVSIGGMGKTVKDAMGMAGEVGLGDIIEGALGSAQDLLNTKIINSGSYVL